MKKYILLLVLIPYLAFCQNTGLFYQSGITVGLGAEYQSVKIGDTKINQMAFPVSLLVPVMNNMTLSVVNNPALSKDDVTNINGLGETKIGLRYVAMNNKLLLKLVSGLPTGKTKYTIEQFNLAKYLSTGSLDYSASCYGRGFDINVGASYAEPLTKSLIAGMGFSYNYKGKFYPLDLAAGGQYDPGDELTINAGLDYLFDKDNRLNLDIIYTNYMTDKIDNVEKFKSAPRLTAYAGYQIKSGKSVHSIYLLDRLKSDNKLYLHGEEFLASNGNQLDLGYRGLIPLNLDLSLLILADFKMYGDIQQMIIGDMFETGKTNIYSFGPGLRIFLTDIWSLDIIAKYKAGKINIIRGNVMEEKDVSGINISGGLSMIF